MNLVQGGEAFISRIPIFLDDKQTIYWGIASIVLDSKALYKSASLTQNLGLLDFSIRGKDGLGYDGDIFFGDSSVFECPERFVLPVRFPGGEWILAARFNHHELGYSTRTKIISAVGVVISFIISLSVYILLRIFRRVERFAAYDSLTQLANRKLFTDHLHEAVGRYKRHNTQCAVLLLDLDHFKEVNDTLGHPMGDRLLQAVAERLKVISRENDVIARLGGDEFIILQNDLNEFADSARFAQKILNEISQVFVLDKTQLLTTASIGIVTCNADNLTPDLLIKHCDLALYHAKQSGRSTFSFHDDRMSQSLVNELQLISDIKEALEQKHFSMTYQPQINLLNGSLTGVEALIRWHHPEKGSISPNEFVSIAEKRGLINEIGLWGLNEICFQARQWLDQGFDFKKIALNISTQYLKAKNFALHVQLALDKYKISAHYLELELTESIFVDNFEHVQNVMDAMADTGITFTIDDFGTGYSSLSYLKNLNVKILKIDRAFVRDMLIDSEDAEIIKGTIDMARALQLVTIAEGIEFQGQVKLLTQLGCKIGQGFLFSHPVPAADLVQLVSSGKISGKK